METLCYTCIHACRCARADTIEHTDELPSHTHRRLAVASLGRRARQSRFFILSELFMSHDPPDRWKHETFSGGTGAERNNFWGDTHLELVMHFRYLRSGRDVSKVWNDAFCGSACRGANTKMSVAVLSPKKILAHTISYESSCTAVQVHDRTELCSVLL